MSGWRTVAAVIFANLLINVCGVVAINSLRQTAMQAAARQRTGLDRKMDAAWTQREIARGDDLVLIDPPTTLTAAEIFGDA